MMKNKKIIFHLLPNAHLDPVWLWDWREGLTEGVTTVKTVLDLMDEYPELTFNRGEAAIYRHVQRYAPEVFERILGKIAEGRWDVVGGTVVQPDSNLSSTETLCRQFEVGLAYFEKELGVLPRIAWQADSFGHPAGWPNIVRSFGMEGFMFTRPQREQFTMESPVFWWNCDYKDRLLCYRQHFKWYCSERANMHKILDQTLAAASGQPYRNVGVLLGLGNHGGGPSRRNIEDVATWAQAHPEVEVCYSTMHRLFECLQEEFKAPGKVPVPSVSGEFGYCLRGCYSSMQKFKGPFRLAESLMPVAETTQAVVGSAVGSMVTIPLDEAWDGILFNSFHDILPGSSIERAVDDQIMWVGGLVKRAQEAIHASMSALAQQVDTRVPAPDQPDQPKDVPILIWNPLGMPYRGPMELEVSLDYRPIWEYCGRSEELPLSLRDESGRSIPHQRIAAEHYHMPDVPWRERLVATIDIPAFGWRVVRMGIARHGAESHARKHVCRARRGKTLTISNQRWSVGTTANGGIAVKRDGKNFFSALTGLKLRVVEDPWGSWGGMGEERDAYCLDKVIEEWKVAAAEIVEDGPERCVLWTRWTGSNSWCDLSFYVNREAPWIEVRGRLLWNERAARLQLVLPSMGDAVCDVPGSVIKRSERGQVPVGRWFTRKNRLGETVGVVSDSLSDADFLEHETRLTLARATRYACNVELDATEKPWMPAADCGELKFRLALFGSDTSPDDLSSTFLQAPITLPVTPSDGPLSSSGSFGMLHPSSVRLLAVKAVKGGLRIRAQNRGLTKVRAVFVMAGKKYQLGSLSRQEIVSCEIGV
jgi:alpha-mannosidase